MERKIDVVDDFNGRKIVFIHDIIFMRKRYVEWKDVKEYLKKYVGEVYKVLSAEEEIYIGTDFPKEYTGSAYTYTLKGANVKAKANAVQGIPEMIEIATVATIKKTMKKSIAVMQNLVGIVMTLILQFRYMPVMEKLTITMCSMPRY